jgi:hypothetical protein
MIKFIIKLAVAALIANAAWRVGSAYMGYYRFEDAAREATQFRGDRSDAQIETRIFELASDYDLPVTPGNLTVRRADSHTIVEGSFTRPIELAPGYIYPWPFSIHIDTFTDTRQRFDGGGAR